MERDLPLSGEDHELGEVVVGADEVADDVALRGDDVDGRHLHRAAVADHVVVARAPGHLPGVVLGAPLADVVEDDLRALAVRHLEHGVQVPFPYLHRLVCAPLLRQIERLLVRVDDDDLGGGKRLEALDADVPQAPAPMTTAFVPA